MPGEWRSSRNLDSLCSRGRALIVQRKLSEKEKEKGATEEVAP